MKRRLSGKALILGLTLIGGFPALTCKEASPLAGDIEPATARFRADQTGVSREYVSMRRSGGRGGRITLDVVITQVDEAVSGIALKVSYPSDFAKFVDCADGDLFPSSGNCYSSEPDSGTVFIGRSVMDLNDAVPVAGSRTIVRLSFLVFGKDRGRIDFAGQNLGGGDASALLDVAGDPIFVHWFSGELRGE